ncbi:FkbM family methyltransferase [Arsenicicoccus dermatophilus]|uniref:FkbM family methyltransferase n=1 Tax=Arsenicicoccus dermatophilus TaxID=1076331 RepID=UPI001F4CC369|nr:FkbM family methyltransferase [Arsenicicoccus dermatophilus]
MPYDVEQPRPDLRELLEPARLTEVVDIGANPLEDTPPYLPMLREQRCRVTGFEPQPEGLARLRATADDLERYLPYAVGDGGDHTLHVCASPGFSSLYEPDPDQLALLVDFPRLATVVEQVPVGTTRLDDVAEIERADHLKIDVQGSELDIFRHGRRVLAGLTTIQVELGFHRIYRDQPTFADVDLELRAQGFVPHRLVSTKDWPLAPVQWADPDQEQARQLVEADVLYVRDLARLDRLDDEQLRHLALVAHEVYAADGVALRAVRELTSRGAVAGVEQRWRPA